MKKWLGILLACILAMNLFPALAEGTDLPENKEGQDYRVSYDNNDLTIGNPTQMNGQFFTALWGSHTSDIDVRQLTAGYNLIRWDGNKSIFRFDHTVVSGATIGDDRDGNHPRRRREGREDAFYVRQVPAGRPAQVLDGRR